MVHFKENKKMVVAFTLTSVLIVLIFLFFLSKNNYKKINLGNNISNKSIEEIEEYILNISSYSAKLEVTVESNRNKNKYILMQKYISPNKYKQVVLAPENIRDVEITYDGKSLKITNSKLNLNMIYEEYNFIINNCLYLDSFLKDYKSNNGNIYEENEKVILETKVNNENNYRFNKKLYIDKKTGNIEKLEVEDINEKTLVYILYNEIKINDLEKNDVLAFGMIEPYARLY